MSEYIGTITFGKHKTSIYASEEVAEFIDSHSYSKSILIPSAEYWFEVYLFEWLSIELGKPIEEILQSATTITYTKILDSADKLGTYTINPKIGNVSKFPDLQCLIAYDIVLD